MKLYTLTYDANQPTTQQVNVPTNTDYKLGIKVKRNGAYQSLKLAEVKLYTGKSTEIEPTDFNSTAISPATATASIIIAMQPAAISADLAEKTLNTIVPEASYDDGTTWQETRPTFPTTYAYVMDKTQGNYYTGRIDISNSKAKWELLDGTMAGVIGTADTLSTSTQPQIYINSNAAQWTDTTFPCKLRLVVKYGGCTQYEYISPDDTGINGYTTFTLSADDNASYTQETLSVETNVDVNKKFELYHNTSGSSTNTPPLSCLASEIGLTGKTIKPEDIYVFYKNNSTTEPTEADLALSAVTYWGLTFQEDRGFIGLTNCGLISGDQGVIWSYRSQDAGWRKQYFLEHGLWDGETPFFFFSEPGQENLSVHYDYTFDGSEIIRFNDRSCNNNNYNAGYFKSVLGEAFSASFTLNTNIFKSQQGDIDIVGAQPTGTATLAGKFADGTDFSYVIMEG